MRPSSLLAEIRTMSALVVFIALLAAGMLMLL